jgi:MtfA peptidase
LLPKILLLLAAAVASAILSVPHYVRWRRKKTADRRFPMNWEEILQGLSIYRRMPPHLRQRLRADILVFLSEKHFVGCRGQEITEEVRVTIAANACMLLLGRRSDFFPGLRTVYVYPDAYIAIEKMGEYGREEHREERFGESWGAQQDDGIWGIGFEELEDAGAANIGGHVVLSWAHCRQQGRDPEQGLNLVIHEFAHQLDYEDGWADGIPPMPREVAERWDRVFGDKFEEMQFTEEGESVLDGYASTHPSEFFAVSSETFFERPKVLQEESPELYAELKQYYGVDPADWEEN